MFPQLLRGQELDQLQTAWHTAERPAWLAWKRAHRAAAAQATQDDGANSLQTFSFSFDFTQPAFTALLEHYALRPFLEQVCSTGDDTRTLSEGGGLRLPKE
eukprot:COSAG01_NODE_2692_length_7245_cov_5.990064_2_plen_101_part_00